MSQWPSTKARRVYAALLKIGWEFKRQSGLHRSQRDGWPDFVFAFHDAEEIGPKMLPRIAKHTGLTPRDLWGFDAQPLAQPDRSPAVLTRRPLAAGRLGSLDR